MNYLNIPLRIFFFLKTKVKVTNYLKTVGAIEENLLCLLVILKN